MKFSRYFLGSERVVKCIHCQHGKKPNGKICKYCNGTGVITRSNQR